MSSMEPSGEPGTRGRSGRRRRVSRWLLFTGLALVLGFLLLEGALRFLLFSELEWARRLGAPLRREPLYCSTASGREYWKLHLLFSGQQAELIHPFFDARVGWLKPDIEPGTLRHRRERGLRGRRPVLLYGDSYAACAVAAEHCWEALLERSELGRDLCLLNYGVGGYGLDQCYLLLEHTLGLYAERDPIVVIGILVEDDLDRSYLGLRSNPKPWFTLEEDRLVLHPIEDPVPLGFVRDHPVGIASYAWRAGLFGLGLASPERALSWTAERDHVQVKQALNARILEELRCALTARGLESFFVLFHGTRSLGSSGPYGWQEPFLHRIFEEQGLPFVSSRRWLLEHARATGTPLEDYFIPEGAGKNHYRPETNEIVFGALLAGLQGRFETP